MSDWAQARLAGLLIATKDGDWGNDSPAPGLSRYWVIRGADFPALRKGDISTVPVRYLPLHTATRRTLEPDDIVIETAGGTTDRPTGRTLLISERLLASMQGPVTCASFARFLRVDKEKASPHFIYWYLQHLHQSGGMWEHQVQHTGVARFQYTRFAASHAIRLPSFPAQAAIASMLGALDDKIAVNDRIARISLALADAVFASVVRGLDFGPETFESVTAVFGGGTPRTSEPTYWNGAIAWTTPTDVTALSAPYLFTTARTISDSGLASCASQLYPAGSIFMTSRATIGAFAVPQMPAAVNQGFIVVVPPRDELRWWLFHEMRAQADEMLSLANGSTFMELSRTNFKKMPIRLTAPGLTDQFHTQVDPLHRRAAQSAAESAALTELRDALLPKLMSREIRVREAEEMVAEVT